MTINPELLERARAAKAVLSDAERQALLARAEYHAAVRRLHLAGASLREVAATLGLSHQRVQQIVRDAGGSWWRRAWRGRRFPPDAICTWCGRPPSEVEKLIAGPRVFICGDCVGSAERAAAANAPDGAFGGAVARLTSRCAFCGKRGGRQRALVTADPGSICPSCLRACREILGSDPEL